jgi:hypothetical protein
MSETALSLEGNSSTLAALIGPFAQPLMGVLQCSVINVCISVFGNEIL